MTTIVVAGSIADRLRDGGLMWTRLHWILGLRALGFDVFFVEQIDARRCVDAAGGAAAFEQSENLRVFGTIAQQFAFDRSAALVCDGGAAIHGATRAGLCDLAASAALLVNISGHLTLPWLLRAFRRKAYIDDDPGFTQFWLAAGHLHELVASHDVHFTFGANIGTPSCGIPADGRRWRPLRPFAVLDQWPCAGGVARDRFTTVASWRGPYGAITHAGRTYGLKAHEFRRFIELPRRAPQTFEIALAIDPADRRDRDALERHGWRLVEPQDVAGDPSRYREYVQGSGAECSVAKGIYVETRSGWFSDRTVCYLASGKPALVQDTGVRDRYPSGDGLVLFSTLDEAAAGAADIQRRYERHCRAARAMAEAHFDARRVLGEFLDTAGIAA